MERTAHRNPSIFELSVVLLSLVLSTCASERTEPTASVVAPEVACASVPSNLGGPTERATDRWSLLATIDGRSCSDAECALTDDELFAAQDGFARALDADPDAASDTALLTDSANYDAVAARAACAGTGERLGLLTLLASVHNVMPRPLPSSFYETLEDRRLPEQLLILSRHRVVAPDTAAIPTIARIASDEASPLNLRYAAITALGHPQSSVALMDVSSAMRAAGTLDRQIAKRLGPSLGQCGRDCSDEIVALASSGDVWQVYAASFAAALLPSEEDRSSVRERVLISGAVVPEEIRESFERGFGGDAT